MLDVNSVLKNVGRAVSAPGKYVAQIENVAEATNGTDRTVDLKFRILSGSPREQIGRYHEQCLLLSGTDLAWLARLVDLLSCSLQELYGKRVIIVITRNKWVFLEDLRIENLKSTDETIEPNGGKRQCSQRCLIPMIQSSTANQAVTDCPLHC